MLPIAALIYALAHFTRAAHSLRTEAMALC
jgi:hypothetical protein